MSASPDMKGLIEYMAQSVVTNTEAVDVEEQVRGRSVTYLLSVDQKDMGRVIGKRGQMANAMRNVLRVAAVKSGQRVSLEISE
jgi:predicted RNA-binding protein YlqC (UPF0109 family)